MCGRLEGRHTLTSSHTHGNLTLIPYTSLYRTQLLPPCLSLLYETILFVPPPRRFSKCIPPVSRLNNSLPSAEQHSFHSSSVMHSFLASSHAQHSHKCFFIYLAGHFPYPPNPRQDTATHCNTLSTKFSLQGSR